MRPLAIITAGFIHLATETAVYFSPEPNHCSPAPPLASWIYIGAVMLLATNLNAYSSHYYNLPCAIQFFVDTILSLIILEVAAIFIWCNLEIIIYHFVRFIMLSIFMDDDFYLRFEPCILGVPTTVLAGSFLFIIKQAVIPEFKIKNLYTRQQVGIQMDRKLHQQLMLQNKRMLRPFRRMNNI